MRENVKNIPIKDLRLWNDNPRYSIASKINIENIGKADFIIEDNEIIDDKYEENYFIYQKRLLNNLESIKATRELIESIANVGFKSAFDDMFVVKPEDIYSFKSEFNHKFEYIDQLYYVVEGNRRLLCMDLILNYHKSRENIGLLISTLESVKETNWKEMVACLREILQICFGHDITPVMSSFIDCKVMNFAYYTTSAGATELNEILNSRHFGNRKGKLNWPRGLILKKIYSLVLHEIKSDSSLADKKNSKNLYKKIENYVGKKIESSDINSALFVNFAIEEWNANNKEKIKWEDTESGDINQSINNLEYDDNGNESSSTEKTVTIFVSSLENSLSNIKLLNHNFLKTTLGKVMKLHYHLDKLQNLDEYITAEVNDGDYKRELSQQELKDVVLLIVESVKNKEINTRSFANEDIPEVGIKIRKILFPNETIPVDKALNWSISEIMGMEQTGDDHKSEILNNISRNLRQVEKNFNDSKKYLEEEDIRSSDNLFKKVLWYIWRTEYGRIIKFKDKTSLRDVPTFIFSLLYRSTYEYIQQTISIELMNQYLVMLEKNEKYDEDYVNLLEWNSKQVNSIISNSFLVDNVKSIRGGNFIDIFESETTENQEKIIKDVNEFFLFVLGLYDFARPVDESIKFSYFGEFKMGDIKESIFFNNNSNGSKFLPIGNSGGLSGHRYEVLKQKCFDTNFFGKLSSSEQTKELFKIIDNINQPIPSFSNNRSISNLVNRVIHKPLSAMLTYENDNDFDELNLFIETLKETEESIMKILE